MPASKYHKFETISKDYFSGYPDPATFVIYDNHTWHNVWMQTHTDTFPAPPLPEIDFDKEMVIGAYLGERTRSGYGIEISCIVSKTDSLEVHVQKMVPSSYRISLATFCQPYHLIKTKYSKKRIRIIR